MWMWRRENIEDIETIKFTFELTDEEAELVLQGIESNLSHDEMLKLIKKTY